MNTSPALLLTFILAIYISVYASQGCCLKVRVVQIHTHFTASFALPSSFTVSSNSIYNLSLVGRILVVIFFSSTVMWNRYVLSCFWEIWGKEATDYQTRLQHLLYINMKVIGKIRKENWETTRWPILWILSFKKAGNHHFSQWTMCFPAN